MDDYMLMMAKVRGEELMREAKQDRQAAEARRAARTRKARGLVTRPALRLATARMRPTAVGR